MTPYYSDEQVRLFHGDCLTVLAGLPDSSVDAVVTDPPYDLTAGKKGDTGPASDNLTNPAGRARITGFMGKAWDGSGIAFRPAVWIECLRVLKPGGHLLSFGGTRTYHRMACAVEDAGFEIRDSISWIYGSGFPKSLDVSKAIDSAAGADREVVGVDPRYVGMSDKAKRALGSVVHDGTGGTGFSGDPSLITAPATPDAARWSGWGTALKPAHEPIVVARKPLAGRIDVVASVERSLRAHGVTGNIQWTSESASHAANASPQATSGGTSARRAAGTSVRSASETGTAHIAQPTATCTASQHDDGHATTPSGNRRRSDSTREHYETPCSQLTDLSVAAAERVKTSSLPSTTSRGAVEHTDAVSAATSTATSADAGSHRDTASFAGIATGLIGSRATVRIDRLPSGTFVWPDDLPLNVSGVAGNVLAFGTGALNIDGCRTAGVVPQVTQGVASNPSSYSMRTEPVLSQPNAAGRWPANVLLDDAAAGALDADSGTLASGANPTRRGSDTIRDTYGEFAGQAECEPARGAENGGASRFFPVFKYEPKAPTFERPSHVTHSCDCEEPWPTDTASRAKATDGTTAPASSSTSKCGSESTDDECPTDTMSTTLISTNSTTIRATSCSSPLPSTNASTPDALSETASGGSPVVSADGSSPLGLTTGTSAAKAGRSTGAAGPATSHTWSETSVCGNCGAPARREAHATVKPLDLMRWLVRLVTPPGGTVLDPFAGSGTTAEACIIEGFRCITAEYLPIIVARLTKPIALDLFGGVA